jgi:hypothetical protein
LSHLDVPEIDTPSPAQPELDTPSPAQPEYDDAEVSNRLDLITMSDILEEEPSVEKSGWWHNDVSLVAQQLCTHLYLINLCDYRLC